MQQNWLLVADAGRARLYSFPDGAQHMQLVTKLVNPRGRARPHELLTDTRGSIQKRSGRHASMGSHTDPHKVEVVKFARTLARVLRIGRNRRAYDRLAVVAPPAFLGALRSQLRTGEKRRIRVAIASDQTHYPAARLLAQVRAAIEKPALST